MPTRCIRRSPLPLTRAPTTSNPNRRLEQLTDRLGIRHPAYGSAMSADQALEVAERVGFPLLVRPSFVLGGRAMEICYSGDALADYLEGNVKADQEHPLLLDRFLENAIEVDVDAPS